MCHRGSDPDAEQDTIEFTTVDLNMCLSESVADKHTTVAQHSMVSELSRSGVTSMTDSEAESLEGGVGPRMA